MPKVAIIGGGFAGAMTAVHLLLDHPGLAVDVTVIEPRSTLGAGLAYGSTDPSHRINVAAARMSPFDEDPGAFDRWLRNGGADRDDLAAEGPDGALFPRRAVFGRYVAGLVNNAVPAIRHARTEAVAAARVDGTWHVRVASGDVLEADILVLATGHPPASLPGPLGTIASDRVIADPWDEAAIARVAAASGEPVVLVGSGLTACDVLASLRARGHRAQVTAISRRGLLPRPRTRLPVGQFGQFGAVQGGGVQGGTASKLLLRVRQAIAAACAEGRPWEDVIAALREQAPVVWRGLDIPEQRRLLRHVRAYWDVHRFQCAPQIAALVASDIASGSFRVIAAGLAGAETTPNGVAVLARARGRPAAPAIRPAAPLLRPAAPAIRIEAGFVVNCTGPGAVQGRFASSLLASLADAGWIRPDALGLGIATDAADHAIGTSRDAAHTLLVAGPPARAAHGELMGLPQVSRQPRAVAGAIAAIAAGLRRPGRDAI